MAMDNPPHIAGLVRPKDVRLASLLVAAKYLLNRLHSLDQVSLLRRRKFAQQPGNFGARALIELGEDLLASRSQRQELLSTVRIGGNLVDQRLLLEVAKNSTEVARIQPQLLTELGRGRLRAVSKLVENAYLGQGVRASEELLLQHANLASVEAVEATDSLNARIVIGLRRHGHLFSGQH